ncbi:MAG: hypothetical protein AAGM22_28665 [Acidobacteriota bacterium]
MNIANFQRWLLSTKHDRLGGALTRLHADLVCRPERLYVASESFDGWRNWIPEEDDIVPPSARVAVG